MKTAFDHINQHQLNKQILQKNVCYYANLDQMSSVGIFRTDLWGNCLYVNQRWSELSGISLTMAQGLGWRKAIHPDDLDLIDAKVKRIVLNVSPLSYEFRFQHPNGRIIWVLSQTEAETKPNGEVIGYIGTVVDITERQQSEQALKATEEKFRATFEQAAVGAVVEDISKHKQAEQALQESEERFHTMADNAPVMVWMSGIDKLCSFFNKNWLEFTGRTIEQELGNGWAEGVHPEDLENCLKTYCTAFDAQQPFTMEYRLRRFDGEYRWILDTGTPIFTTNGSFAGYIGSCIDISDRKLAELTLQQRAEELTRSNTILAQTTAMLQKRNQELDQFAYVASHDLKAPLRAIASLSEWLEEDLADQLPPENQHQMQLLRGRVRRMEALINGLLEYSRIGRIHTESSLVNVGELLKQVIDSLQPPSTFSIEIAPGMPTLITKRFPLQQVFANLIENAINHHSRGDGRVKISVQDQRSYYKFAVADDGPGIAPEYHDQVFAIFQTLEPRDRKENTGIGLAIVKKIVETEGGTITLDSIVGTGSTFHFVWPKQLDE